MQIGQIILELKRTKSGTKRYAIKSVDKENKIKRYHFEGEDFTCCFSVSENFNTYCGSVNLEIHNHAFRASDNLVSVNPITFYIELQEQPRRITAMYLHRDWWTRPAFIHKVKDIPERTQAAYFEYDHKYAHLLALSGEKFKTTLSGSTNGHLKMSVTANVAGFNEVHESMFIYNAGEDFYKTVHETVQETAKLMCIPRKVDRNYPQMFEYLGWCSWDAFYTEVNQEKIRRKVSELQEKKIPVKWILIDDGWLSVKDEQLTKYEPDSVKFPNAFKTLISDIKENSQIEQVGVWHALPGYWGGIHRESKIYNKEYVYSTRNGKHLPYPHRDTGRTFYDQWYQYLSEQGISFVKVDGQSAIKNYYEDHEPLCEAARETHHALESAVHTYMNDQIINCMGMAMENIMGRGTSALSRNSDDFLPNDEQGFYEHLLQNAYNAVYHDEFYFCDWDMFWSSHFDAKRHAALRAISGGPVYISDKIGETNEKTIKPLILNSGQVLRLNASAKPTIDCMFTDPKDEVLKLFNTGDCGEITVGALACFNETNQKKSVSISYKDFIGLDGQKWIVYDVQERECILVEDHIVKNIPKDDFLYFNVFPMLEAITPIGLVDKWNGFIAIESVFYDQNQCQIRLKEGGMFGFYGQKIKAMYVNGVDRTKNIKQNKGLNYIHIDSSEDMQSVTISIDY